MELCRRSFRSFRGDVAPCRARSRHTAKCVMTFLYAALPAQHLWLILSMTRFPFVRKSMWPDSEQTENLLGMIRSGDDAAINQLFERHRNAVRRMIDLRMDPVLKRRVDASDIVQEVLIEANRRLQIYLENPAMPFHLWIRQMAKDRLIDAHRRHRTTARRSIDREQSLSAPASGMSSYDLMNQLRDSELTPASAATWEELRQRFESACRQLEEQDQEIVFMRHFEFMSNNDAATALQLSPQAASMRYLRAMRRLRKLLDSDDPNQAEDEPRSADA